tara:strand:+ start:2988 stop:3248 length:261 start_codon:yes stop_codon:yes gene_type:complete
MAKKIERYKTRWISGKVNNKLNRKNSKKLTGYTVKGKKKEFNKVTSGIEMNYWRNKGYDVKSVTDSNGKIAVLRSNKRNKNLPKRM